MKEFLKKNFAIVLAFVLPVAFIAIITVSAYLPSLFSLTNYNFVYLSCTDGTKRYRNDCYDYFQRRYSVVNKKIVVNQIDTARDSDKDGIPDINENYIARIFLHDTKKNESREIALEEAQTLSLNGLFMSPDGVNISDGYVRSIKKYRRPDFFFLFGFDEDPLYGDFLEKGKSMRKLNLIDSDDGYYDQKASFIFIGWVLPGRN